MSLIRDDDEACLVELHAQGSELLERYRELLDDEAAPPALAGPLRDVAEARGPQLAALAERLRARDVLPSAGDPDRAFVQVLGDLVGAEAGTLADRLVEAESRWADTLADARAIDWSADDRAALEALARHIESSRQRFADAR
ncbi:hypothetical protein HFP89_05725 [Wenzhouxiangella sp. XN79A]|uniref:hypothetical protein n=1 Tax=Wenzhouxiangella sp. XN79A TaxID=2724193 RepID=UPI00144AA009|nr:hypothetical protein [Wenzhouxiangella sp. XN79A]NKI34659.1 hypothetical protein [Wenzhouxiangella sp. XN79A]